MHVHNGQIEINPKSIHVLLLLCCRCSVHANGTHTFRRIILILWMVEKQRDEDDHRGLTILCVNSRSSTLHQHHRRRRRLFL